MSQNRTRKDSSSTHRWTKKRRPRCRTKTQQTSLDPRSTFATDIPSDVCRESNLNDSVGRIDIWYTSAGCPPRAHRQETWHTHALPAIVARQPVFAATGCLEKQDEGDDEQHSERRTLAAICILIRMAWSGCVTLMK